MNFLNRVKNLFFGGERPEPDNLGEEQQADTTGVTQPTGHRHSGARPAGYGTRPGVATSGRQAEPVLREAGCSKNGGVQGLGWYAASQIRDRDGDFANEFLEAEASGSGDPRAAATGTAAEPAGAVGKRKQPPNGTAQAPKHARQPLHVKSVHQGTVVLGPA